MELKDNFKNFGINTKLVYVFPTNMFLFLYSYYKGFSLYYLLFLKDLVIWPSETKRLQCLTSKCEGTTSSF